MSCLLPSLDTAVNIVLTLAMYAREGLSDRG